MKTCARLLLAFGSLLLALGAAVADVPPPAAPAAVPREVAPSPPAMELVGRRAALSRAVGDGLVLIEARGGESERVERDFFYLSGLETAGAVLVIEVAGGIGTVCLYLPSRSSQWERWNGPRAYPGEEAARSTGIDDLRSLEQAAAEIDARIAAARRVYHLPTVNPRPELESPDEEWRRALRERHPGIEAVEDIRPFLHPLRQRKGEDELARLARAAAITGRALVEGFAVARPGRHEFEVEAAIEASFRAHGAEGPGFDSIVGSGPNSCVLHHQSNDRLIGPDELLILDVGASWGGYTADITRTIPVSGRFSARQREVYDVVARAQAAGIAAARPGATIADVDRAARRVAAEAGLGAHYLHGTSHHVGLEVHDVGPHGTLLPGMVITVEPGLYLVDEGFGIRIEDMVRITETGAEKIPCGVTSEAEGIEALLAPPRRRADL